MKTNSSNSLPTKWQVDTIYGGLQVWKEEMIQTEKNSFKKNLIYSLFLSFIGSIIITRTSTIIGSTKLFSISITSFLAFLIGLWIQNIYETSYMIPSYKTEIVIDSSMEEIFAEVMDLTNIHRRNPLIKEASIIQKIDENTDIIHIVLKHIWLYSFIYINERDLCLLRYWKKDTNNNTMYIYLKSTNHPECSTSIKNYIRSYSKGQVIILSPKINQNQIKNKDSIQLNESMEDDSCLVTHIVHLDPKGLETKIILRYFFLFHYLKNYLTSIIVLRQVMETYKFVRVTLSNELSLPKEIPFIKSSSNDTNLLSHPTFRRSIISENTLGPEENSYMKEDTFITNFPREMWCEPESGSMLVRGPDYLHDHRKIPSAPSAFRLVGVDLFETEGPYEHIASHPHNIVYKINNIKNNDGDHENNSNKDHDIVSNNNNNNKSKMKDKTVPFTFLLNFIIPGTTPLSMVFYYQPINSSILSDSSAFAELMHDFLAGTDKFRDERFKLIPCIVEGNFIVRQAVGSTPAIIGKKLRQPYYSGDNYFELDIDICSSSVANRVVGLVVGYTKKLVIDMGFLIEGQTADELPERLFGSVRLKHVDLSLAKKLYKI